MTSAVPPAASDDDPAIASALGEFSRLNVNKFAEAASNTQSGVSPCAHTSRWWQPHKTSLTSANSSANSPRIAELSAALTRWAVHVSQ